MGIGLIAARTGRLAAQQAPAYSLLVDTMVAMRDGVRLHTAVYAPASLGETAMPIVFMRTPHGIADAAAPFASWPRTVTPSRFKAAPCLGLRMPPPSRTCLRLAVMLLDWPMLERRVSARRPLPIADAMPDDHSQTL